MSTHKQPLSWYEDNACEIRRNSDGSVTFTFDEPRSPNDLLHTTSSTTISEEDYQKAQVNPQHHV